MKTNKPKETMNYNEKHLLKQLEKDNSLMEFTLFKEDNKAENFSDEFHFKFTDLYNQINHEKNIKKDLENDYSIQQKRLYPDDIIT